ncbi:MAG: hypothetical protein QXX77_05225 [Candidatus Methanosuratincola sp.]|jgi:Cu/Ag efflux protein CusF
MRFFLLATLLAMAVSFAGAIAEETQHQPNGQVQSEEVAVTTSIKGEVTKVTPHGTMYMLSIKDEAGESHTFEITDPKMVEGVKVGDTVTVTTEDGKVSSVEKVEKKS